MIGALPPAQATHRTDLPAQMVPAAAAPRGAPMLGRALSGEKQSVDTQPLPFPWRGLGAPKPRLFMCAAAAVSFQTVGSTRQRPRQMVGVVAAETMCSAWGQVRAVRTGNTSGRLPSGLVTYRSPASRSPS